MIVKRSILAIWMAGLAAGAAADAPFATATFEKKVDNSDDGVPIASATLSDMVCFVVRDVSTPEGDHSYRLVVYDGAGNEVHQSISRITARDGKWAYSSCYRFHPLRDKAGSWWYVAELDDQPLVTKELVVAPAP